MMNCYYLACRIWTVKRLRHCWGWCEHVCRTWWNGLNAATGTIYTKNRFGLKTQHKGFITSLSSEGNSCFVQRGNVCWEIEDHSELLQVAMFILVCLQYHACGGLGDISLEQQEARDEKSNACPSDFDSWTQNTDRELISTVEGFRREFEHLPETVYDEIPSILVKTHVSFKAVSRSE